MLDSVSPLNGDNAALITQDGARATAIAYSIMNTAKFNGLRVYEYLEHLLDTIYRIPKNLLDLNKFLPWSQEMQAAFRME